MKFLSRGSGYTLFLTADEAVISLRSQASGVRSQKKEKRPLSLVVSPLPNADELGARTKDHGQETNDYVRMKLAGANRDAKATGIDELPGKINYLIGNDPKKWVTHVPTFARVKYHDVYPGVDLVYYGNPQTLEFDFALAPGADPQTIRIRLEGASALKQNPAGDLVVVCGDGREIRLQKPRLYQKSGTKEEDVAGRYILLARNEAGFEVGPYNHSLPLLIDPVLTYSTYLGTANYEQTNGLAIDASGSAYIAGFTSSSGFPVTSGALSTTNAGGNDAFITKLDPSGSSLVYSTYLGGSGTDQATGIAVDASGNAYISGETLSSDFPTTTGAPQVAYNGMGDAFVAKLSADGASLVYSTFLGGTQLDVARGIAIDSSGNAYVTGTTFSSNFPTLSALQPALKGSQDAFVAELNASGALVYSTYLGGSGFEQGNGIAVDGSGNAYVTGYTSSADFPMLNAVQAACKSCPGPDDAFITEIASNGTGLVYSTYLGGSGEDDGMAIAVDAQSNTYVTGFSFSSDFPATAGAFQTALAGGSSAFVAALAPNGAPLMYATYLGADNYTMGASIAASNGNAYIVGLTHGNSFPVVNPTQSTRAGFPDGFVTEVNANGTALYFSTFLGGTDRDEATSLAIDSIGDAYISGLTKSTDFPVVGAYQGSSGGGDADAFATKIHVSPVTLSTTSLNYSTQMMGTTSPSQQVTVTNNGSLALNVTGATFSGADPQDFTETDNCNATLSSGSTCAIQVSFAPTLPGTRTGTLNVAAAASGSPPQIVNLTGAAVPPPVYLSPPFTTFANQVVGTTSAAQILTLSNNSSTALNISSVAITGANIGDYAQTNNCPPTLAVGSNCTLNVTFTPAATGTRAASVAITDNANNSPQTTSLTGTGIQPAASFSPASLTFTNQQVGTASAAQAITLTNTGTAAMNISGIALGGANSGDFAQTNNCPVIPATLAPSSACTINITFTPTAAGTRSGVVTVADDAPGSPQAVSLSATGTAPVASFSSPSVTFAGQQIGTTSAPQVLTLTNSGTAPLTISTIALTGANPEDFAQTTTCPIGPATLASAANCTINVTFTPAAVGARTGTLTVTDNAAGSPQAVSLSGTGTAPAVGLSPAVLTFANQKVATTSVPQAITLTNIGTAPLTITTVATGGTNGGDFAQATNCPLSPTTLAVGGSCAVNVTFTPSAMGTRSGTLSITDNASNSPQAVSLAGTGADPLVALSPASLTFSSQVVGTTSAAQSVTLVNSGDLALTISAISATGGFAQTNACTSVAPGANCKMSVTFNPMAAGGQTGALTITDNAPGSPHTLPLTGTGADFSINRVPGSSASASVAPGGTALYLLSFAPAGGFNGAVSVSCTGAPAETTCAPSPTSLTLDGTGSTTAKISVTTTAPSSGLHYGVPPDTVNPRAWPFVLAWLIVLASILALRRAHRESRFVWPLRAGISRTAMRLSLATALLLALLWTSCGGGGSGPAPNPGTAAGTYSLTVTATYTGSSTTLQHSFKLTLMVK